MDVVEVTRSKSVIVVKPKLPENAGDVLIPDEEPIVRNGEAQLTQGQL